MPFPGHLSCHVVTDALALQNVRMDRAFTISSQPKIAENYAFGPQRCEAAHTSLGNVLAKRGYRTGGIADRHLSDFVQNSGASSSWLTPPPTQTTVNQIDLS